jgi:hypothetical protein
VPNDVNDALGAAVHSHEEVRARFASLVDATPERGWLLSSRPAVSREQKELLTEVKGLVEETLKELRRAKLDVEQGRLVEPDRLYQASNSTRERALELDGKYAPIYFRSAFPAANDAIEKLREHERKAGGITAAELGEAYESLRSYGELAFEEAMARPGRREEILELRGRLYGGAKGLGDEIGRLERDGVRDLTAIKHAAEDGMRALAEMRAVAGQSFGEQISVVPLNHVRQLSDKALPMPSQTVAERRARTPATIDPGALEIHTPGAPTPPTEYSQHLNAYVDHMRGVADRLWEFSSSMGEITQLNEAAREGFQAAFDAAGRELSDGLRAYESGRPMDEARMGKALDGALMTYYEYKDAGGQRTEQHPYFLIDAKERTENLPSRHRDRYAFSAAAMTYTAPQVNGSGQEQLPARAIAVRGPAPVPRGLR